MNPDFRYNDPLKFTFPQVREAVTKYVEQLGDGEFELYRVRQDVAGLLGFDRYAGRSLRNNATQRFDHQVSRALNLLFNPGGVLVKIGRGQAGPDDRVTRETRYFTRSAWQAARERALRRSEEAEALRERWATIREVLILAGLKPASETGFDITLRLEDWERLAVSLERRLS